MNKKTKINDSSLSMQDGAYENMATGLGFKSMDKAANTTVSPYTPANLKELASMKVKDGIARFIVDGFAEASLMKDITITNDSDGDALRQATELGMISTIKKAGSFLRLTGGAVVVTEYDGDNAKSLESEPKKGAKVKGYRVYSAGRVDLQGADFKGEEPSVFRCRLIGGGSVNVHPSRCTVFHGEELPDVIDNCLREQYFGVSALYGVADSLKDLGAVVGSVVNMAQETGVLLLRMSNLSMMLSKPDCGVADIQKVMSLVKLCMSSMRAAFAGKDDDFNILSHNFAGLPEVITKLMSLVSAKCRIPMSILFGQSATGLAQTNEGDIKAWCSEVSQWRSNYLYKPSCKLIADFAQRNLKKDFSEFEWGVVDEMTLTQLLNARKTQAEYLEKYFNMGSLFPDEIRENVFKNGHSWEVFIDQKG